MQKKMMAMLALQNSMNHKVHPEWRAQNFQWYRAIWVESAELMDHFGWKWWKKQTLDMEQVKLEIIDIWHFGLSMMLQKGQSVEEISTKALAVFSQQREKENLLTCTEHFVSAILPDNDFDLKGFHRLMVAATMTFDDLYCGYIGKNVLNFFRQDHGYKEGAYKKNWQGREDNLHLAELVQLLDHSVDTFKEDLYKALEDRYALV